MEDSVMVEGHPAKGPVADAMKALWQLLGTALRQPTKDRRACLIAGIRNVLRQADKAPAKAREVLVAAYQDIGRMPEQDGTAMHVRVMRTLDELGKLYKPALEANGNPDVIVPLGNGSKIGNMELRMLLRSIDVNLKDHGRIFLATHYAPDWVNQDYVTVVDIDDGYKGNKDANLHRKTLETIRRFGIEKFVWCADDNCFMQPVKALEIPDLHTGRGVDSFQGTGRWHVRVRNTFKWAKEHGTDVKYCHEVHVPQLFNGQALLEAMRKVDYMSDPGLTIYTTWRVALGTCDNAVDCTPYRVTVENNANDALSRHTDDTLKDKMMLCYADPAVNAGLMNNLSRIFPHKSRFER